MTLYYLESSALAKLFVQEPGSEELIELVEPLEAAQKITSSLSGVEFRSAVRRRHRSGDLASEHVRQILETFEREGRTVSFLPVSQTVLDAAALIVDRHPLRALDALHLASYQTVRLTSGITDFVFVSSDERLLAAASSEGYSTLDPTA